MISADTSISFKQSIVMASLVIYGTELEELDDEKSSLRKKSLFLVSAILFSVCIIYVTGSAFCERTIRLATGLFQCLCRWYKQ